MLHILICILASSIANLNTDLYAPRLLEVQQFFGINAASMQLSFSILAVSSCVALLLYKCKATTLLRLGLFIQSFSCLYAGTTTHFTGFLIARALAGISINILSTCLVAYCNELLEAQQRNKILSYALMTTGVMANIVPYTTLVWRDWQSNFILFGLIIAAMLVLVFSVKDKMYYLAEGSDHNINAAASTPLQLATVVENNFLNTVKACFANKAFWGFVLATSTPLACVVTYSCITKYAYASVFNIWQMQFVGSLINLILLVFSPLITPLLCSSKQALRGIICLDLLAVGASLLYIGVPSIYVYVLMLSFLLLRNLLTYPVLSQYVYKQIPQATTSVMFLANTFTQLIIASLTHLLCSCYFLCEPFYGALAIGVSHSAVILLSLGFVMFNRDNFHSNLKI